MTDVASTIVIADDHVLVRDGFKLMVATIWPGTHILEAADATTLRELARRLPQPALASWI